MRRAANDSRRNRTGFSLIECVLALGVVSFAFVALVGTIPVGLTTFQSAIDATVGSQIAQTVIGEVKQAKFSECANFNKNADIDPAKPTADYFFDEDGAPAAPSNYVYEAAVVVHYTSEPPVGMQPTQLVSDPVVAPLAVVRVIVRRISAPDLKREFTAMVANNGF